MYWIPIIICRFYVKIGTFNKIIEQADFCKNYYWLVCLDVHHVSDLIKAAIYHLNDIMEWLKKNVLLRVCSVCVCQYGCLVCKTVDLCVQIETNKFPSNLLCWSLWGLSFVKFSILPFWNAKKKNFGWWLKFRWEEKNCSYLEKSFVLIVWCYIVILFSLK